MTLVKGVGGPFHSEDIDLDDKESLSLGEIRKGRQGPLGCLRSFFHRLFHSRIQPRAMSIMLKNPFQIDHVMERLVRRGDICHLKMLRKMGMEWNHLSIKELEKRASKLQLKPNYFSREMTLDHFLEDTKANSRLFTSFQFLYPQCLEFRNFYSLSNPYNLKYIGLLIRDDSQITHNDYIILHNFLRLAAPNLKEIKIIKGFNGSPYVHGIKESPISPPHEQLIFPKLIKFSVDGRHSCGRNELMKFFKFILDKSRVVDPTPSLTFLEIHAVIDNFFNVIGMEDASTALSRWTRLTHLKIECSRSQKKLTTMLVSLSEGGMSLQFLALEIIEPTENKRPGLICSNYSRFFQLQSKSLKILQICYINEEGYFNEEEMFQTKIKLPVFENVHTLKLKIGSCGTGKNARSIFKMGPFHVHFPKLETLKVFNHQVLEAIMYPEDGAPIESIPTRHTQIPVKSQGCALSRWSMSPG